ncbi:GNAT family N-acetyltransferase [Phenylobacterium sp.]|uniref:GNAT family N-acetyltransferase n=1 Tax=Phenylobacterium sp. TaxID=1871053 RepID=UPI003983ACD1
MAQAGPARGHALSVLRDLAIETPRFVLRALAASDRDDLFAHFADPATVEHMDIQPLTDPAQADAIIDWATGLGEAGVRWTIRDRAGAFKGTVGFNSIVRERASRGEIAYDVVRGARRQGVMAEVLPAVLEAGFGALGLHRIEAMVTPGNVASTALLAAHGFTCEGTLRDHAFWKGRFWDQQVYARLSGR